MCLNGKPSNLVCHHALYISLVVYTLAGEFINFVCVLFTADVRDDEGRSPLDSALEGVFVNERCVDVCHYLINHGCGGDKERVKLLMGACHCGNLSVVKEIVEQYKVNPNGECVLNE